MPKNPATYAGISIPVLQICASILNDRIETAAGMLRLHRKHSGTLPLAVAGAYARDYLRAVTQLKELHSELERRIGEVVNL